MHNDQSIQLSLHVVNDLEDNVTCFHIKVIAQGIVGL